jgi:hypothetical protein
MDFRMHGATIKTDYFVLQTITDKRDTRTASSFRVTQGTVIQQGLTVHKPYHCTIDILITCEILSLVLIIYKES